MNITQFTAKLRQSTPIITQPICSLTSLPTDSSTQKHPNAITSNRNSVCSLNSSRQLSLGSRQGLQRIRYSDVREDATIQETTPQQGSSDGEMKRFPMAITKNSLLRRKQKLNRQPVWCERYSEEQREPKRLRNQGQAKR
ncbi:hypothetical protein FGO68_gene1581 [Halteria grandinella]|uniref:Uncharacterized protein n=1 Tax=Halteria grandinella TaxID=5974 RepID=A0A8J8P3Q6_HALGN|nr:hypothetical protein FGO68_gene1581 [Halteria grandinella]